MRRKGRSISKGFMVCILYTKIGFWICSGNRTGGVSEANSIVDEMFLNGLIFILL